MASAHAKKQEQLKAGKRMLEEFRKKKTAASQGKKASSKTASKNGLNNTNVDLHETQPLVNGQFSYRNSDEPGTSGRVDDPITELNDDKTSVNLHNIRLLSGDVLASMNDQGSKRDNSLLTSGTTKDDDEQIREVKNENGNSGIGSGRKLYDTSSDSLITSNPLGLKDIDGRSNASTFYGLEETHVKENDDYMKDFSGINTATSYGNTVSSLQNKVDHSRPSSIDKGRIPAPSFYREPNPTNGIDKKNHLVSNGEISADMGKKDLTRSAAQSYGFESDKRSEFSQVSLAQETNPRRSRPSFLDSISIQRASSTPQSYPEQTKTDPYSVNVRNKDSLGFSSPNRSFADAIQPALMLSSDVAIGLDHHTNSSLYTLNGDKMPRLNEDRMENKGGYYSHKQDEDFAALEQHIEDLTQEKFSLQRALESSRALAESLASENSALTDSYNQQGSLVNQLKGDMGRLQEEIKDLLGKVDSLKMEYANAHLECNAADERAKLLASEVISLEEKVLRLRSNELKLGRQLEKSAAEHSSQKKKLSSFEKERQDLQSTIDALLEEKKLLQSKLLKASKNDKFADVGKSAGKRRDMSTTTEDLDDVDISAEALNRGTTVATYPGIDVSLNPENAQFNAQLPYDQLRTVDNIKTLLSELALEKEELLRSLLAESSQNSKFKELNKELSRKLESQTQRLELLTAQNMANVNAIARKPESYSNTNENTAYADEGDEVVERVLGWIMKLFPGGPSRRRR
ncbi:protein BLISTER-like isoform X1 [Impatiens glandulifera]|uniref:protein BLISTER-like isoform X1 n=1 Tax=Impatiens glandulifera TaxID=253017 RepID=UPI001FB0F02E|nr:protein BLISTER-like isoform X1 [Impatiens glandulifera]